MLGHPRLRGLRVLAGDPARVEIERVGFVEQSAVGAALQPNSMAVLGYDLSVSLASDHLMDVTLREWTAHHVRALVFTDSQPFSMSVSVHHLAERMGLLLLQVPDGCAVHDVLVAAAESLSGDAASALHQAHEAASLLSRVPDDDQESVANVLQRASEGLGVPVTFEQAGTVLAGAPVLVDGHLAGTVTAGQLRRHEAMAAQLVCALVAERIRYLLHSGPGTGVSRNVEYVLSELLVANEQNALRLTEDAKALGVRIDSWHRAMLLHPTTGLTRFDPDFFSTLGHTALRSLPHVRGWHMAHTERGIVLIQESTRAFAAEDTGVEAARNFLHAVDQSFPALQIVCGIGTPHHSLLGLRISVVEASLAVGRTHDRRIAVYDAARLQPVIVELANAGAAGLAIRKLLQPFERLERERAHEAVQTLSVYLDEQGSLTRSAERLQVHRNTVAYRIAQVKRILDSDLDDPDERLALQLACRSYDLWSAEAH